MINLAKYVRENPIEGETPSELAKQGYIIMNIYELILYDKEITINNLMELNGFSRQKNLNIVESLVNKGLLIEDITRNYMGRGRLYVYSISEKSRILAEKMPQVEGREVAN